LYVTIAWGRTKEKRGEGGELVRSSSWKREKAKGKQHTKKKPRWIKKSKSSLYNTDQKNLHKIKQIRGRLSTKKGRGQ